VSDFVHLHLHSQYSLLDGANRLQDVIDTAGEAGNPAMGLTDHGNMFGAIEFYNKARKSGVKPIVGIEAYVTPGDMRERKPGSKSNHLVLLAQNETGYKNLIKLTSRAFLEGFYYRPRIDHELMKKHSEGIVCLSACLQGEVNQAILTADEKRAEALACEHRDIFGEGNYYLEMQYHGIEEQERCNEVVRRISQRTGIPLVITNDCHYLRKDDAVAHDVLLCIGTQKMVSDSDRMRYASDNFYMKSADEMYALFPQDAKALENTLAVAESCELEIPTGQFHLPDFPVPSGYSLESYFEEVTQRGLEERFEELRRLGSPALVRLGEAAYHERLEREIGIIKTMGFPGYFMITWDFMRYARESGIPVGPGRGSAAGSLVSYALRITDIDPLQYDLLFERFLNPERISMPDIDIDFCMRRRSEVIQYVAQKYGRDHVAQIITFGTLAAKAVIRDVGRVMGVPYAKVDRISKLIPDMTRSLAAAAQEVDELKSEAAKDPEVAQIIEIGSRLEGLTRHASVHAAGVVITPRPLEEVVPLYKNSKDEIMTQWDKDIIEGLGLLKMDFLGLRTLTVIHDAVTILAQSGIDLDLDTVPLDDGATFQLFCDGRTDGIFQFESRGMKDLLRRAKPSKFEDLAAFNALYRPGALSVGMVEEYIQRKQGRKKVRYILAETKELLEETYGVIVYQEQVMQIAVTVAGFTMGQADLLRKAMGKKSVEAMAEQKEKFLDGAESQGFARAKAQELWDYIEPFAGYGFNKSHSVAYAMLAYKTAYLKVHHPVAFMAAMLNSELSSSDSISKYVRECNAMGIEILQPDVNESDWWFTVVGPNIRFGLGAVKGVGEGAIEAVLESRHRVGKFTSFVHFATQLDLKAVNRKVFEASIKAGCFDSLAIHRAALMEALDKVLDFAQRRRREEEAGQENLFANVASLEPQPDPATPEWSERDRLSFEKEALGFYVTGNPLEEFRDELDRLSSHNTESLKEEAGNQVTVGGLVARMRRTKIKSGRNAGRFMGRFVLEDLYGSVPVMLFANQLQQFGHLLEDEAVVIVKAQARSRGSELELSVDEIVPLQQVTHHRPIAVEVRLSETLSAGDLLKLRDLLIEHPGAVAVELRIELADAVVVVKDLERYKVDAEGPVLGAIERLLGRDRVHTRFPKKE